MQFWEKEFECDDVSLMICRGLSILLRPLITCYLEAKKRLDNALTDSAGSSIPASLVGYLDYDYLRERGNTIALWIEYLKASSANASKPGFMSSISEIMGLANLLDTLAPAIRILSTPKLVEHVVKDADDECISDFDLVLADGLTVLNIKPRSIPDDFLDIHDITITGTNKAWLPTRVDAESFSLKMATNSLVFHVVDPHGGDSRLRLSPIDWRKSNIIYSVPSSSSETSQQDTQAESRRASDVATPEHPSLCSLNSPFGSSLPSDSQSFLGPSSETQSQLASY